MLRSIFGPPLNFQERMEKRGYKFMSVEEARRLDELDEGTQRDAIDDQDASGVKNAHQTLLAIKRLISDYEATHKGE